MQTNQEKAANLRLLAVINRRYADAGEETYARTGRESALHMAELHRACADQKEARAATLDEGGGEEERIESNQNPLNQAQ